MPEPEKLTSFQVWMQGLDWSDDEPEVPNQLSLFENVSTRSIEPEPDKEKGATIQ